MMFYIKQIYWLPRKSVKGLNHKALVLEQSLAGVASEGNEIKVNLLLLTIKLLASSRAVLSHRVLVFILLFENNNLS